jgi:hypothetical protein
MTEIEGLAEDVVDGQKLRRFLAWIIAVDSSGLL